MEQIRKYLGLAEADFTKLLYSILILLVFIAIRMLTNYLINKKLSNVKSYALRRITLYVYTILSLILIGRIWIDGLDQMTTVLGLASAGIAIALHDIIADMAGGIFIITRKPFKVGDRIQIGDTAGDVIDIRFLQFSIVEIGNWVDAEQSTGRIIHIPNNKVLKESLANYQIGFEYIWHEIPVLITFESDWKKAKGILADITEKKLKHLSDGAEEQIKEAAEKYLIFYSNVTPIVYLTVKDSGVLLTIRYLLNPRQKRSTEQQVWENILEEFEKNKIDLAYPTMRNIITK